MGGGGYSSDNTNPKIWSVQYLQDINTFKVHQ